MADFCSMVDDFQLRLNLLMYFMRRYFNMAGGTMEYELAIAASSGAWEIQ